MSERGPGSGAGGRGLTPRSSGEGGRQRGSARLQGKFANTSARLRRATEWSAGAPTNPLTEYPIWVVGARPGGVG